MAERTAQPSSELDRAAEEAGFYHEAALNAAWTGVPVRRSARCPSCTARSRSPTSTCARSTRRAGGRAPAITRRRSATGTIIMACVVVSAVVQYVGLQRIKAGAKSAWQSARWWRWCSAGGGGAADRRAAEPAVPARQLGFLQRVHRLLPGDPGELVGRDDLAGDPDHAGPGRCPAISFVEQPPTYAEAFAVQRFQSSLSAFTADLELPRRRHDLLLRAVLRVLSGKDRSPGGSHAPAARPS